MGAIAGPQAISCSNIRDLSVTLLSRRAATTSVRSKTRPQQDLEPVGTLEEVLVEKNAMEYWRLGVAASHEARELEEAKVFLHTPIDRILRYQTTINRQLYQAMNQLERLQRLRKGDNVHAPHSRSVQPPLQT